MRNMRLSFTTVPFQVFLAKKFGGEGRDLTRYLTMALAAENSQIMQDKTELERTQILDEYRDWKKQNEP